MAKVLCFGELLLRLATNRSEFIQDQGRLTSNFGGSEVKLVYQVEINILKITSKPFEIYQKLVLKSSVIILCLYLTG